MKNANMRWAIVGLIVGAAVWAMPLASSADDAAALQDEYLRVYLKLKEAEALDQHGDKAKALAFYEDCRTKLIEFCKREDWEKALLFQRIQECETKIKKLKAELAQKPKSPPAPNQEPKP